MQDPRIKILVVILLSIAAFASMAGAVLAFLFWIFLPGKGNPLRRTAALFFLAAVIIVALILQFTSGTGLSYFVRMTVILLLALYAYEAYRPGEFFGVFVWLFGTRGFDIGLVAEMSLQALHGLEQDISRIRMALRQKGTKIGLSMLVPVVGMVVLGQIGRGYEKADLLTVRGYRSGGTFCPVFHAAGSDYLCGIVAILILLVAFLPLRDIFILLQ